MNRPIPELTKNSLFAAKLIFIAALLSATSVSAAEESSVAYVDSVLKWGAWGLDIEPAAGGLSAPSTTALNARDSKLAIRTNSFSALAPSAAAEHPVLPPPVIPPPINPVPPPIRPTITSISPNVPVNIGGPGGSTPTPGFNTLSPNVAVPTGGPGGSTPAPTANTLSSSVAVPTGGPGG